MVPVVEPRIPAYPAAVPEFAKQTLSTMTFSFDGFETQLPFRPLWLHTFPWIRLYRQPLYTEIPWPWPDDAWRNSQLSAMTEYFVFEFTRIPAFNASLIVLP